MPFESVAVKVECETLIPAADNYAFLASWEGFVGEAARLEYERTEVKGLPGFCRYSCGCRGKGDEDGNEEAASGVPARWRLCRASHFFSGDQTLGMHNVTLRLPLYAVYPSINWIVGCG